MEATTIIASWGGSMRARAIGGEFNFTYLQGARSDKAHQQKTGARKLTVLGAVRAPL